MMKILTQTLLNLYSVLLYYEESYTDLIEVKYNTPLNIIRFDDDEFYTFFIGIIFTAFINIFSFDDEEFVH